MKQLLSLLLFFCLVGPQKNAYSQNYYPIYNFGTDGVSHLNLLPPASGDYAPCTIRDDAGNYFMAGYTTVSNQVIFAFVKVLPNGDYDPSFGNNGVATLDVPNYTQELINGIALQPDGKLVFVGKVYKTASKQDAVIGRLLPNGQIDTTFNNIGYRIVNCVNRDDDFLAVGVQPDGKIVAGGTTEQNFQYDFRAIVCRFLSDGSFDNSFATSGTQIYSTISTVAELRLQQDGKIVIGGDQDEYSKFFMSRLLTNGEIDSTFGTNGIFTGNPYSLSNTVLSFEILPNDDFLVISTGSNQFFVSNYESSRLFRLTENGVLDTGYFDSGYLLIEESDWDDRFESIFLRTDGSCLLAGTGYSTANYNDRKGVFCEITSAGILNTVIGTNGFVNYSPSTLFENFVYIFEETDGVVCAGWENDDVSSPNFVLTKKRYCTPTSSTLNVTECTDYTIDGVTYTQSGTYPVILRNANASGCDSTITLNLTINQSASTSVVNGCEQYFWEETGQTYTTSGDYIHIIQNSNGCDSTITLNLTINQIDETVSINGITLTANQTNATYQWIDCAHGNIPIQGEIAQTFTPSETGTYAVEVTVNGCTVTSDCFLVTNDVGIKKEMSSDIKIYPNPTSDKIHIESAMKYDRLQIFSMDGRICIDQLINDKDTILDISKLTQGAYRVLLIGNTGSVDTVVVKY